MRLHFNMRVYSLVAFVFGMLGVGLCVQPHVPCPAPRSPEHGQTFLYQEGRVVKYVCEPGFALQGKEMVRCINGEWEDPNPACLEIGAEGTKKNSEDIVAPVPVPPARPLFSWGSEESDETEPQVNDTDGDVALSDEARIRLLMYPRKRARIVTSTVRTGKLQSATELEEEEKKRSKEEKTTAIHLESPPSVMYVRRTVTPGKSEAAKKALDDQYQTASIHMTVGNGDDVQLVSLPRAAVSVDDKGHQLYWYGHPNYRRIVEYRSGVPVVMTLTESQLAWINSLHPELRDQYLKDLYGMRAEESVETERAQAFLQRYEDAYNYVYHMPYVRRPVSLIMEDPISTYDYTCNESGHPFVKAPRLRNMHIARYDRRQNPNNPHNDYLSVVYRCNPGYVMLDTRYTELHCSKKSWVGVKPVCVRRG